MAIGTLDFSGFAPAMSPGQAGIGGFVAPTADDPLTSASQIGNAGSSGLFGLDGQAGGVNWGDLSKTLGGVAPQGGQQQGSGLQNVPVQAGQAGVSGAQSGAYGPRAPVSLDQLVQMLMARTNAYRQAANARTAEPVPAIGAQRVAGLLGL